MDGPPSEKAVSRVRSCGHTKQVACSTLLKMTYQSVCLCGKFKLELTGPPIICVICHCSICRRHTAGAFSHMVSFPTQNVRFISGEPSELNVYRSSDALARKSCPAC